MVTTWDYGDDKHYMHDEIATDKRNPTVNAYGLIFGSPELSTDNLPIVDPVKNTATTFHAPVRDKDMPYSLEPGYAGELKPLAPSAYWGNEQIWDNHINNHNSMFDGKGRLWLAAAVRGVKNPDFCGKNSDLISAKLFPLSESHRQIAMLDPKTMKYTFVDTCFQTHHLQCGFDNNDTLWASSGGGDSRDASAVGWLNTKKFLETGDAAHSQGWTALIVDTAGAGKREGVSYTEPGQPLQPGKDMRSARGFMQSCRAQSTARCGARCKPPARTSPARWCASISARTRLRPPCRRSIMCLCPASARAAATSIPKASCGYRWRAVVSAARSLKM